MIVQRFAAKRSRQYEKPGRPVIEPCVNRSIKLLRVKPTHSSGVLEVLSGWMSSTQLSPVQAYLILILLVCSHGINGPCFSYVCSRQRQQQQQRVFIADDKFSDVIACLERRGWQRSGNANSPNFRLKWRNLSNINFRLLRNDQV